jgi:muramoyltetrapeptide carboxypeptidase LdcA involved in peptidoglycan recycling
MAKSDGSCLDWEWDEQETRDVRNAKRGLGELVCGCLRTVVSLTEP